MHKLRSNVALAFLPSTVSRTWVNGTFQRGRLWPKAGTFIKGRKGVEKKRDKERKGVGHFIGAEWKSASRTHFKIQCTFFVWLVFLLPFFFFLQDHQNSMVRLLSSSNLITWLLFEQPIVVRPLIKPFALHITGQTHGHRSGRCWRSTEYGKRITKKADGTNSEKSIIPFSLWPCHWNGLFIPIFLLDYTRWTSLPNGNGNCHCQTCLCVQSNTFCLSSCTILCYST